MEQPGVSLPSSPLSDKQRSIVQQYVNLILQHQQAVSQNQQAIAQLLIMAWPEFDVSLHDYDPSTGTLVLRQSVGG